MGFIQIATYALSSIISVSDEFLKAKQDTGHSMHDGHKVQLIDWVEIKNACTNPIK